MKYIVAFVICIMLLFIPKALLGVDSNSIDSASLNLVANFSSTANDRSVIGFTKANDIGLFSTIAEENNLDLAFSDGAYSGSVNMYYQMYNSKSVSVALSIDTPFMLSDGSALPATVSFKSINITGYNKSTTADHVLDIENGNSTIIFQKPVDVMSCNGYTTLDFSVNENDIIANGNHLNIGAALVATISLVATTE